MSEKTPVQIRYDKAGPRVAEAFRKHYFEACYVSTREEAVQKVLEWIPKTDVVSWGGSATLQELGVQKALQQAGYTVIDRDTAANPQERDHLMHQALLCDTFLMSSNAATEDGQLFNIDGNGNRVAALCYGPKSVVVVLGMNKVVKTMEDAVSRARHTAAPSNVQRFAGTSTPCFQTGLCADCTGPDCICAYMVATRISRPHGKIKVILVGEDLGM
ncbi:MAG: lactate utilization protein [Candidatus Heritagella sp.]